MHKLKKLYIFTLSVSAFCFVLSQILLLNDNVKNKLSTVYRIESKYVYSEQQIPRGSVQIEISHPDKGIYLLQNGETVAELNEKNVHVDIYDNTVVEIDGRNTEHSFLVKIKTVSDNIGGYFEEEIVVDKNIVILGRFFVK